MSAVTGPDNSEVFNLERYLAAISIFGPASEIDAVDASFCTRDFDYYSPDPGPGLSEEAESLEKMGLFQSYFEGATNQKAYSPRDEEVLEAAGQVRYYIDSKYGGDIEKFINEFSADDREYLRESTRVIELLEPV